MQLQPFFSFFFVAAKDIPSAKNCATYAEVNLECIKLMPSSTLHVCMMLLLCVTKPILEDDNYSVTTAQFSFWLDTHYIRFSFINSSPSLACSCSTYIDFATAVVAGVYIKRHWSINTYLVNHHHDAQRWAVISFIEEFCITRSFCLSHCVFRCLSSSLLFLFPFKSAKIYLPSVIIIQLDVHFSNDHIPDKLIHALILNYCEWFNYRLVHEIICEET